MPRRLDSSVRKSNEIRISGFTGDLCTATADCLATGCLEGEV